MNKARSHALCLYAALHLLTYDSLPGALMTPVRGGVWVENGVRKPGIPFLYDRPPEGDAEAPLPMDTLWPPPSHSLP